MTAQFAVGGVAIDLDGTLLDTLPDIADAARRMLYDLGRPPAEDGAVRACIGDGIPRLVKRLLTGQRDGEPDPAAFERALPLFERHYRDTFLQRPLPFPGVLEGLVQLRAAGLQLACVTNKSAAFTLPLLAAARIAERFDLVVSGDSLPAKKPDPLPLRHVASCFGLDPGRLLVIGDSDNDTRAARAAGCPVLCVPYGYRGAGEVRDLDCDAIVPDLLHVCALITPNRS
ncbi:MAG TPA: phosphoglycolate phosphatase [Burkholderiales bacterium]